MPRFQAERAGLPPAEEEERSAGRARLRLAFVFAAIACILVPGPRPAAAQKEPGPRVRMDLMVTRMSREAGQIDPRAARLDKQLAKEFRYGSLEVVKSVSLDLAVDEVGGMELPTGKRVRVRPLLVDERGVLLAVEVEGSVQTDLRVRSDQLVIIGTERSEGGKLVISLEAHL